jgi:hypothetical protein
MKMSHLFSAWRKALMVGCIWYGAFTASIAYEVRKLTLDELVDRSIMIASVRINSAMIAIATLGERSIDCGYDYSASIIDKYKGNGISTIVFRSSDRLTIGNSYLVFTNVVNFGSMRDHLSRGRNDQSAYDTCTKEGPKLAASEWHGEIYEFDDLLLSESDGKWLKDKFQVVTFPPRVNVVDVKFGGASVPEDVAAYHSYIALDRRQVFDELRRLVLAAPD